tara:strand:- start:1882 stop:3810 length:1929 start_codon:yes stop_codon:yes gene_type:complete
MCGFVGAFSIKGVNKSNLSNIENALKTFENRGPDEQTTISSDNCILGFNRLAINDLNSGTQPRRFSFYQGEDPQDLLCFNGEIFNYKELERQYLKPPYSRDEVGVLVDLYRALSTRIFSLLNGQFSIIIYNSLEKRLIISRDPFGIRPLFYSFTSDKQSIYFSSDIRALDSLGVDKSFDPYELARIHLTWSTAKDKTIWQNIRQVEIGTFITITLSDNNTFKENTDSFWSWPEIISNQSRDQETKITGQDCDQFRYIFNKSILSQTMSDVGYCSYLSGGIDSSVIAYELSSLPSNLKTFSVTFDDDQYDESFKQKLVANHLNTNHFPLPISDTNITKAFKEAVYNIQQPFFRTAPIPLMLLAKELKIKGEKVVLTGEGADEILLGYDIFRESECVEFVKSNPDSKWRYHIFDSLYSYLPQFKNPRYRRLAVDTLMREGDFSILKPIQSRLSNNFRSLMSFKDSEKIGKLVLENLINEYYQYTNNYELDNIDIIQLFEINNLLSGYLLSSQGDRVSMASSIEGRYPFLDLDFVKYSFTIPRKHKLHANKFKRILKESYKDKLPEEIINAPKIAYQSPEARSIIKVPGMMEAFKNSNSKIYETYDYNKVDKIISRIADSDLNSKRGSFGDNLTMCILGSLSLLL